MRALALEEVVVAHVSNKTVFDFCLVLSGGGNSCGGGDDDDGAVVFV